MPFDRPDGSRDRKGRSKVSLDDLADEAAAEAVPLISEDIRTARAQLGMTQAHAAERVRLGRARYRDLEEGRIPGSQDTMRSMISAARQLGLKSVRVSYSDEVRKYLRLNLSTSTLTLFVDDLEIDIGQLKALQYFVRPYVVFALVKRIGLRAVLASGKSADKQIVELWAAAVFALSLDPALDRYVRLVKDDPPDAEILTVDPKTGALDTIGVEITRHGKHSRSLFDVLGKKLRKRYREGTVLIVFVEQLEQVSVNHLHAFLRKNNPHGQDIFVIGASSEAESFKIVPCSAISSPTPGEISWAEATVDEKTASKGHRAYVGVSFEPHGAGRLRQAFAQYPIYVKKISLSR